MHTLILIIPREASNISDLFQFKAHNVSA
jgi:hypothetical protein